MSIMSLVVFIISSNVPYIIFFTLEILSMCLKLVLQYFYSFIPIAILYIVLLTNNVIIVTVVY